MIISVAFNILKTNEAMQTSSLVDLFGRKADLMQHSIERFVEDRCGKRLNMFTLNGHMGIYRMVIRQMPLLKYSQ